MGFFSRFFEKRGDLDVSNKSHWILEAIAQSGVVTAETALATTAVFACVRVIAETIASLPLIIYERLPEDRKQPAKNHPLYPLLHDIGPTPWLTAPEFWENTVGHNVLRGNAYSFIVRNGSNRIAGLFPLNPARMEIETDLSDFKNPIILYRYTQDDGIQITIPPDDIWHLKGMSTDGLIGLSPLTCAKNAISLSNAAESHGSTFFRNGARPSGIASYPGSLKEDAYKRFKDSVQESISGSNKFKVLLLEMGASWQQIGMSNEDSQFLETRQFQTEEIARIFRVPAILIGHPDKSSTYASAEQFMISFVTHTIRPWLVRLEKSINKHLLSSNDQKNYFAEFKIDGLLRGDIKSRYEAYAIARQNRWMSANEIRALENLNPIDGGDSYENPNIDPNRNNQNAVTDTE